MVGLDIDALRKIGVETDLTPYGSLVRLSDLQHSAFKPVTHGQFRHTKLNIIDKFGQAVAAIEAVAAGPLGPARQNARPAGHQAGRGAAGAGCVIRRAGGVGWRV